MWFTWAPGSAQGDTRLQFYVDGETTPTVDLALEELFSGGQAPFLFPLVGSEEVSSGGYYSYLPVPFSTSLKVVATAFPQYYNITYERYDQDVPIASFTGGEDTTSVIAKLTATGTDPKAAPAQTLVESGTVSIPAGGSAVLLDRVGPGTINSVQLSMPQIVPAPITNELYDDGAHVSGITTLAIAIDPANTSVDLMRRVDYGIANQAADVYVDGVFAGSWSDAGSDTTFRWRDSSFAIPAQLTAGKSSLDVEVRDQAGGSPWTQYYYWVRSTVAGEPTQTDSLDVGDAVEETAHQYSATSSAAVTLNAIYPAAPGEPAEQSASRDVLTSARATWWGQSSS
jgi:hypothetical protein